MASAGTLPVQQRSGRAEREGCSFIPPSPPRRYHVCNVLYNCRLIVAPSPLFPYLFFVYISYSIFYNINLVWRGTTVYCRQAKLAGPCRMPDLTSPLTLAPPNIYSNPFYRSPVYAKYTSRESGIMAMKMVMLTAIAAQASHRLLLYPDTVAAMAAR